MNTCLIPLLVAAIGAGPGGVAMKLLVEGNNRFAVEPLRGRPGWSGQRLPLALFDLLGLGDDLRRGEGRDGLRDGIDAPLPGARRRLALGVR